MIIPLHVVDLAGGFDVSRTACNEVLADFLNRCALWGVRVCGMPVLRPRLTATGAVPVHVPLLTEPVTNAEALFATRSTSLLLPWPADGDDARGRANFEAAARELFATYDATSDVTVIVHPRGDSEALETLGRIADACEGPAGLVDVVVAEGGTETDPALCDRATTVLLTSTGADCRRLRSLALAAATQCIDSGVITQRHPSERGLAA
jgi:hypothetical protein